MFSSQYWVLCSAWWISFIQILTAANEYLKDQYGNHGNIFIHRIIIPFKTIVNLPLFLCYHVTTMCDECSHVTDTILRYFIFSQLYDSALDRGKKRSPLGYDVISCSAPDPRQKPNNRACKWNRKRSHFMSAKLSLGDIMATEMQASDDTIMNKCWNWQK